MNDTLQTGLAWLGGISAVAYIGFGIWITVASVLESRRIEAQRAELRARRAPITRHEIEAVDIDAELTQLLKGEHQ
jgi:hypothetical protein